MKSCVFSLVLIVNFFSFAQKISDSTFTAPHNIEGNIKLSKRFINQIADVKPIELKIDSNRLIFDCVWLRKTSYESSQNKELIQLDVKMRFEFIFNESQVKIEATALEFLIKNNNGQDFKNDQFVIAILNNNIELFYRNYIVFLNTKNPNENESLINSVEILLKAENQQDIAFGLFLGSGVVSAIVARQNPTAALIISGLGGISGLIVYVASRVNKRNGLQKLKEAA